jgi:hypothetical protein
VNVTCTICGLGYCDDLLEDRLVHQLHCYRAQRARDFYGSWLPLRHHAREAMKRFDSSSPVERIERTIRSHFARSLAAMDYDINYHPSFEVYASAWLADEQRVDPAYREEGIAELAKRWPPRRSKHLAAGSTCWRL